MVDINEIENAVVELENKPITYDICLKLASLYSILDHYKGNQDNNDRDKDVVTITEEPQELLPNYSKYCELKGKYQIGELSSTCMLTSLSSLCTDMEEFILTLYSTTDCEDERKLISQTLYNITKTIETRN